jgi:murein DD-endopeptidase MepM/ murein hydrolase activator NlpD
MVKKREHHLTKKNRFQILIVPEGDSGAKWSFVTNIPIFTGIFGALTVLLSVGIVLMLGYTPLGSLVPISDEEMQRRYGVELVTLQQRLNKVSEEVIVMREYNMKLRSILGEDVKREEKDRTAEDVVTKDLEQHQTVPDMQTPAIQSAPPVSGALNGSVMSVPVGSFRASFPISLPVIGYVSRRFDDVRKHYGIDYAGRRGTVISAAADGYVVFAGWTYEDGSMMILSHGGGYFTVYKHNQSVLRSANEFVRRGQPIALLGNSGKTSYGPHLHFEVWKDGQPQNPEDYIFATESLSLN